jgi:hypothetical protein
VAVCCECGDIPLDSGVSLDTAELILIEFGVE